MNVDPATVQAWFLAHKWAPIIALVVGLLVRLVKSDSHLPGGLPAWFRPYFALTLSLLGAGSAAVMAGIPWQSVIEQGLIAFMLCTLGHETLIEGVRGGAEFKVPFLTKADLTDEPPKPANDNGPPPPAETPPPVVKDVA